MYALENIKFSPEIQKRYSNIKNNFILYVLIFYTRQKMYVMFYEMSDFDESHGLKYLRTNPNASTYTYYFCYRICLYVCKFS